jgi:hypothetical protein
VHTAAIFCSNLIDFFFEKRRSLLAQSSGKIAELRLTDIWREKNFEINAKKAKSSGISRKILNSGVFAKLFVQIAERPPQGLATLSRIQIRNKFSGIGFEKMLRLHRHPHRKSTVALNRSNRTQYTFLPFILQLELDQKLYSILISPPNGLIS